MCKCMQYLTTRFDFLNSISTFFIILNSKISFSRSLDFLHGVPVQVNAV